MFSSTLDFDHTCSHLVFLLFLVDLYNSIKMQGRLRGINVLEGPKFLLHACDDALLEAGLR